MLNIKGINKNKRLLLSYLVLASITTMSWGADKSSRQDIIKNQDKAIPPIINPSQPDQGKAELGKALFNEKLFSNKLSHACASCHDLKKGGADNRKTFIGNNNREGTLNTPTILNARFNFRQFWDGRANTLRDAINDHIDDKHIFNNKWETILERIQNKTAYVDRFNLVYSDGINQTNIEDALVTYIETLVTPNAPFDKYLLGDKSAISKEAITGYELFSSYGCISCHQGPSLGGNLYQKMGIYKDYLKTKKVVTETDLGRYNVTTKDEDILVFKVPSLRNIALTGPYLHDGSAKTLEEAVQMMAEYQIGQQIPKHEISEIVKFLETLTGELPSEQTTDIKGSN